MFHRIGTPKPSYFVPFRLWSGELQSGGGEEAAGSPDGGGCDAAHPQVRVHLQAQIRVQGRWVFYYKGIASLRWYFHMMLSTVDSWSDVIENSLSELLTKDVLSILKKNCKILKVFLVSDQWSPINTEGKKQYTRDFLMQLQRDPQESTHSVKIWQPWFWKYPLNSLSQWSEYTTDRL